MRKAPANRPTSIAVDRSGVVEIIREYEVITPLLGGGVDAGVNDSYRLIREDAINGCLRFWWRACKGGSSVRDMHERECRIWGGPGHGNAKAISGKISYEVQVTNPGTVLRKRTDNNFPDVPPFAAFALADKPDAKLQKDIRFKLRLRFPKANGLEPDIEAALWAWETFGGIGARTRRGFGAIHAAGEKPKVAAFDQWLAENLTRHVTSSVWPSDVPHLAMSGKYKHRRAASVPEAWSSIIDTLKAFRQARQDFHRSYWPEPDEVRRMTGAVKGHTPTHPVHAFPRAQLGLPIIFDFLKRPDEPQKTTLTSEGFERLASPLILRPFQCADGVIGLAAGLIGSEYIRNDLVLSYTGGAEVKTGLRLRSEISDTEAAATTTSPIVVGGVPYTDLVDAFLARFQKEVR